MMSPCPHGVGTAHPEPTMPLLAHATSRRSHRSPSRRARTAVGLVATLVVSLALAAVAAPAQSAPAVNHDRIVSAVPGITPAINNGSVQAIAQVGGTMVVGGTFTTVTPVGGAATTRNSVMAFDVATGALVPGFNPTLNGTVNEVIPGPTAGTVYLGGTFTTVNGAAQSHLTLVSTSTGAVVTGFRPAATNGLVNTMVQRGNRLFVGGNFTTAGGVAHVGLASLNATTGALDAYTSNQVAQRHNDTGQGAQGAVGVRDLDVNAAGTRLVAIGNFKRVDGLSRDQVVLLTLGASSSTVTADWQTNRYSPYCFNFAFDTYVRGVSFSPDGSYFVVAATGGQNAGTLCDAAARFETSASSLDVQPTWVNYSGGDTLWGVTVTEKTVYLGGHQRWLNNSLASDTAGPGAVPRPGIAALNVNTGVPLKWNPCRNPRGAAVYALLATPTGLWMGSDTEGIGPRFNYRRPRLAFFPLASGAAEASDTTADLPGTAYLGGRPGAQQGNIVYRVNAAGPTLGAVDSGPDWTADNSDPSPYRNGGSNISGASPGATTDASVPSTTPNALFDTERWSPSDNPAMNWAFPTTPGVPLTVRLYFANRCGCTSTVGSRSFDVSLDGTKVLDNFDIVAATGDQRGTMRSFDITSDGLVNIDFAHRVENPLVNGIEILRRDLAPPGAEPNDLRTAPVTTTGSSPSTPIAGALGIDWTQFRGSFVAGGKLWYGKADGTFNSRTYSAGNFGPEVKIDPYNDPVWAGVDTGSGNTFDGNPVNLYSQLSGVTGMAYAGGKLYYTKTSDSNLYWRWFNTDSGIVGSDTFTANGGRSWADTVGLFAASGRLYFASKTDGSLSYVTLGSTGPSGLPTLVDSPLAGGNDWRSRALFLVPGSTTPANTPPTAAFTSGCVDLVCTFDGSTSTDADGTVTSYAWTFGDGGTATGQTTSHTYGAAGTYSVGLTVTDDKGATNVKTGSVTVSTTPNPSTISHVASAAVAANTQAPRITVPSTVQAGDQLLLTGALSNVTSVTTPAGWTLVANTPNTASMNTVVFRRTAVAGDAGTQVTVAMDAVHKAALSINAYRGASTATLTAATDSNTTSHTTPTVTVPAGSWVVSIWTDKSTATTKYTTPPTVTSRSEAYSTGTGRMAVAVADSGGARTGTVTGTTATTDATSSRGINLSVVLAP